MITLQIKSNTNVYVRMDFLANNVNNEVTNYRIFKILLFCCWVTYIGKRQDLLIGSIQELQLLLILIIKTRDEVSIKISLVKNNVLIETGVMLHHTLVTWWWLLDICRNFIFVNKIVKSKRVLIVLNLLNSIGSFNIRYLNDLSLVFAL